MFGSLASLWTSDTQRFLSCDKERSTYVKICYKKESMTSQWMLSVEYDYYS